MNLIIVESPTKAKILSRFLGSGYQVEATYGHLKDLPKSKFGVDLENSFKPDYQVPERQIAVVAALSKAAQKANKIYVATDPDREGEAIAQHAKDVLENSKYQVPNSKILRIVFHEITKQAVEEALKNPGKINKYLVDAQTARRVLDRVVGYKLSPILWKKVRRGLSAGRVQSVAVRLIVEREREIEKFKPQEYWEIGCDVKKDKKFRVDLLKKVDDGKTAGTIVADLKKAKYIVADVEKTQVTRNPYPPFTTSTMTQAAARKFGWSAKNTMRNAQKLYEHGLITYHRTDSTNVAKSAQDKALAFIESEYGKQYLPEKPRFFKTKSKVAQEAHEAVRPTNIKKTKTDVSAKLYTLIRKRFLASQMAKSVFDRTTIDVTAVCHPERVKRVEGPRVYLLRATGQIIKFDGWQKVYSTKVAEDGELLPDVEKNDTLQLIKVHSNRKFTQPPARFNEASLIKTLEKLGIGRPSTYAPTITTIQIRQYVEKEEKQFKPTAIGFAVNDFLVTHFPEVFDYQFTAAMEENLDCIARGECKWVGVISDFYKPFDKKLGSVEKNSKRVKIETEKLGKKCPQCGTGELVIRVGRFGKFISCSTFPECRYAERFVEKLGMKCPECQKGEVIVKKTKKGRSFYGCSRYSECQWASWTKPEVK